MVNSEDATLSSTAASPLDRGGFFAEELSQHSQRETCYTATSHLGLGPRAWKEMVRELVDGRELIWRLFLRDFSARYRQSMLGYVWAFVPAIVTTVLFSWLNRRGILPVAATPLPYPVFLLISQTVWLLFANGLNAGTQSLVSAGSLITKINFPRESLVIAAVGQSVFEFLVRSVLLIAAFVYFAVLPPWTIVLVPAAVVPLILLTLGLAYLFSLVNGVMRDAGQMITFALMFWMFITPVVYPPRQGSLLNILNPVSPFVIAVQDLSAKGHLTQPGNFAIGCTVALVVFLASWRVFHLTEPRIAERV